MRRILRPFCVSLVCLCCLASAAVAVDPPADPGEAVLCIYTGWDEDTGPADADVQYEAPQVFTSYPFYIVLYHPRGKFQQLGAFEFSLKLDNAGHELIQNQHVAFVSEIWCPGQGGTINFAEGSFNYIVGIVEPYVHGGEPVVLLAAEIMFFDLQSQSHVFVFCQESVPSSIPGQMSYVDRGDPEVIRRMLPNNDAHDLDTPVFAWSGVVAVETRTWTGVKSLFAD